MELGLVFNMLYNIYMKFINKNWEKLVLIAYTLIVPVFSLSADTSVPISNSTSNSTGSGMIVNPLGTQNTLPVLIQNVLNEVITIGIPIVALAIIYCGFLFVFARGNSEKLTSAKQSLLYTLIGAAIF